MFILIKNTLKKTFFIFISLNCLALDTNNTELIIDISEQRLYLKEITKLQKAFLSPALNMARAALLTALKHL